jgi:hypothetical protein
MKELYREGVANHPGPEPCECSHKAALKRWVSIGWVLSSEIKPCREPTASGCKEGNHASHASASAARPCGVEDPKHVEKLHAREPGDPAAVRGDKAAGRRENAMSDKSLVHGGGESYSGVVPASSGTKAGACARSSEARREDEVHRSSA